MYKIHKMETRYRITKRIAKHGKQAIIVIPKKLQEDLSPETIVDLEITIIRRPDNA